MHRVCMCVDREGREVSMLPAELIHISAHDQRINANERDTLLHFIISISCRGKRGCDIMSGFVGHLFDPHYQGRFDLAGGNSYQSRTKRGSARGTSSFHFYGFLFPESDPIRKISSKLILPIYQRGKHIANKQCINLVHAGILHGGEGGVTTDLTQGKIPMLINFDLTNSKYSDFSHSFLCEYFN